MPSFWKVTKEVVYNSDVVLIVIDARFPEESFNRELLEKSTWAKKPTIFVLNKSELVTKKFQDIKLPKEMKNYVWFSALKHYGVHQLRKMILSLTKKRPVIVGVVGYPNTGKSSLINCLGQRHATHTSPKAGFTKGMQKVRVAKDVYLYDTPGVLPYKIKDEEGQALIGAVDANKIKDPDVVAMRIIEKFLKAGHKTLYDVLLTEDLVETLENIARKRNFLIKGGLPDIMKMSRVIISDWQRGKLLL